ncbi:cytochrome c [Aliamphritea spongicola]|nr:cytochrome c [Aliamphritea spongicola]
MATFFQLTPETDVANERGKYLVEAVGHCAACHTPETCLAGYSRIAG